MQTISSHEFNAFCHRSDLTLLKTTYNKPKLFESKHGEIVKVFHPRPKKKRFSSTTHKPYAVRFQKNTERLQKLGLITPTITSFLYCPELNSYIVTYEKIPGRDLRVLTAEGDVSIIESFAKFTANLHNKGIFFRSIHLENLLYLTSGNFALLDVVDVQFKKNPLSIYQRWRNLKHLFFIKDDKEFWSNYGVSNFLKYYFKFAKLSYLKEKILTFFLKNHR